MCSGVCVMCVLYSLSSLSMLLCHSYWCMPLSQCVMLVLYDCVLCECVMCVCDMNEYVSVCISVCMC